MRNPNGYGGIVDLGKGRRKRYAVRKCIGYKMNTSTKKSIPQYKYIGYFEKRSDAMKCLAKYNSGEIIKEHESLVDKRTFVDIYNLLIQHKCSLKRPPSPPTIRNYNMVLKWLEPLTTRRFDSLKLDDLQFEVNKFQNKSESTVCTIKTVLTQMYTYAIKREIVPINLAELVDYEWEETEEKHAAFTINEVNMLWEKVDMPNVDLILMMIYTGLRASEFIKIENRNVHIDERYLIGGMKTKAGTNRTIPINKKVLPFFSNRYDPDSKYLIKNTKSTKYSYGVFYSTVFMPLMESLNLNNTPHDTRHTFSTLMDRAGANDVCTKLIIGHSIQDLTKGTYTHKELSDLLKEVDKI